MVLATGAAMQRWSTQPLDEITGAYDAHTALDRAVPVSFTRFGSDIQAISACTVALGPVFDDPLAALAAVDGSCRRQPGA